MSLESTVKYHFPKSTQYTDSPRATASDALTGTDQMAAMGMVQSLAPMGFSAFMGRVGVSEYDARRAVALLTEHALKTCDKVAALRKLDADIKPAVMQILASYAYMDYCRSAASKKPCECCQATGFIDAEVVTMKSLFSRPSRREVREQVRVRCGACKGKGVVSAACSDCNGRGKAVNRKLTEEQGVPVIADCKRCGNRGFERIPSTEAHRAVCEVTDILSLDTWKKSVKPFYDSLIVKLEIEESWANSALRKVTA
ncbi:antitermination protein [Erwinia sp. JH02]|uniref:antitermination protein n=1 Tax=Erwinia sp. JH02 TaxID=2733394 RepID=UPI001487FAC8|nr:antitermination protein [Erwinia sp. JH02]NNS07321.1 antitermination protein [Erwinia sp. JH02]